MKTKQFKKQNLRKNCRWLLWIVGFIFFQGACSKGTPLTKEEQEQFTGLYVFITTLHLLPTYVFTNPSTQMIHFDAFRFKPVKHQDVETLKGFSNSLDAKYYLQNESNKKLVVMSDGSIHFFKEDELNNIIYKILNDTIPYDEIKILFDAIRNQITKKTMIIDNFKGKKFEEIANNIDSLLEQLPETLSKNRYRRIPIDAQLHPKVPKQTSETNLNDINNQSDPKVVAIITGFIIFIIVVICVCVKCCQNWEERTAVDRLEIETNDISDHYPAPTDLVLDVKETETKQSASISTVSAYDTKTSSTNLLTTEVIDSEEPTSMQSMKTNSTQSIFSFNSEPITDIEEISINFDPLESADSEVKKPKAAQSEFTEISDEKLLIS